MKNVRWVFACLVLFAANVYGQTAQEIEARTEREIGALVKEKASRTPVQAKIDCQLIYADKQRRNGYVLKETPDLKPAVRFESDGRIKVDIIATVSDDLVKAIVSAGGEVSSSFPRYHAICAVLPLAAVGSIAAWKEERNQWGQIYILGHFN